MIKTNEGEYKCWGCYYNWSQTYLMWKKSDYEKIPQEHKA